MRAFLLTLAILGGCMSGGGSSEAEMPEPGDPGPQAGDGATQDAPECEPCTLPDGSLGCALPSMGLGAPGCASESQDSEGATDTEQREPENACPAGTAGCACFSSGACGDGLSCLSGLCVAL